MTSPIDILREIVMLEEKLKALQKALVAARTAEAGLVRDRTVVTWRSSGSTEMRRGVFVEVFDNYRLRVGQQPELVVRLIRKGGAVSDRTQVVWQAWSIAGNG